MNITIPIGIGNSRLVRLYICIQDMLCEMDTTTLEAEFLKKIRELVKVELRNQFPSE